MIATSGSDIPANQIASFVFFQRTGGVQPALTIAEQILPDGVSYEVFEVL